MCKNATFRQLGSVLCCYKVDPLNLKYKQYISFSDTSVSDVDNVEEDSLLEVAGLDTFVAHPHHTDFVDNIEVTSSED